MTRDDLITLLADVLFAIENGDDITDITERIRAALEAEREQPGALGEMPW